MFLSVCKNNPENPIHFHLIVDESVRDEQTQILFDLVQKEYNSNTLQVHHIDSKFLTQYPSIGKYSKYISQACYYRLFLAELLPEKVKKILYLDCDIIVRHDLQALWEIDLTDKAIGCVIDLYDRDISLYNRLHYPLERGYFNSGVLLVNLDYWRKENLSERFVKFIENNSNIIRSHDQDVLNCTLSEEKIELPLTYNFQSGFYFIRERYRFDYWAFRNELERTLSDPAILHYTDFPKPWFKGCKHPFRSEFIKYYQLSPWGKMPLKKNKESFKKRFSCFLRKIGILSSIPNYYRHDIHLSEQ